MNTRYQALWVEASPTGYTTRIINRSIDDLPQHDTLIKVAYSSLNYKDALSCSGNKAVTRQYPHQPGIDAAGTIVQSQHADWVVGEEVIVTGFDLGMNTAGGLAEYIRVPANWVIKKPHALSLEQSMMLGTAGLTAGLCIKKLLKMGLTQDQGPILVTGATGGVGAISLMLLTAMGYNVIAVSGKENQYEKLQQRGASQILSREAFLASPKALKKPLFAAAIDVAGGDMLAEILKQIKPGGSVACCGLVAGTAVTTSVMPFILRGVNLLGVDSVEISAQEKAATWQFLATHLDADKLNELNTQITLNNTAEALHSILKGKAQTHFLVRASSC